MDVIIAELCPAAGIPGYELVRQPVDEALSKVLTIPEALSSEELLDSFLIEYLSLVVFDALEFDFGSSFSPDDSSAAIRAEEQMKAYVHSIVEVSLPKVVGVEGVSQISADGVQAMVSALIVAVLNDFESGGAE